MKWIIWNKTEDTYWCKYHEEFSSRWNATKFSLEELEEYLKTKTFYGYGDPEILAVIAIHI